MERKPPPSDEAYIGLRIAALALLGLSLLLLWQALQIRQGGFNVVGPRVFPIAVSLLLLVISGWFLLRVTRWPDRELGQHVAAEARTTHWPSLGLTLLALLLYPFALNSLGYVVATTFFFPVVARILGSRSPWRDLLVGVLLAGLVYLVFTRLLNVRLPAGVLGFLP
jgi:putative tricarboxylic transport membrane protein